MHLPNLATSAQPAAGPLAEIKADVLVVGVHSDGDLDEATAALDSALEGAITSVRGEGGFKANLYESEWLYPVAARARRVLLIGAGKSSDLDVRVLRRLAAAGARQARNKRATVAALALPVPPGTAPEKHAEIVADGALSGLVETGLYKDEPERHRLEAVNVWSGALSGDDLSRAVERGVAIAESVALARWLGDEPGNVMTPVRIAEEAARAAGELGLEVETLDEDAIREAGMGSLLSVADGSQWPPRVVVMRYRGNGDAPFIGYVGKGVSFDTGGISIKPSADMHYMKYDMCGAAAVVGAVTCLARVGAKANVIGVLGLVENMPGGRATRPGDVVKAANGKSIEIINTDAEGRLVLADVLDLARKRGAERLVDVATLTGAIKVALGTVATGVMGSPQGWVDDVVRAAGEAGERAWPMPLFPEYKDGLKSNVADMMNTGGRFGGAITAAMFLKQFVGDTPWAHLDVAGTAWTEKDSSWQTRGATGSMIRTLVHLAETRTTG